MPLLKCGLRENNKPSQWPSLSVTASLMANMLWHTTKRQLILIITAPQHHSSFWQASFLCRVDWGGVEPWIGGTQMNPLQTLGQQAGWMKNIKRIGVIKNAFVHFCEWFSRTDSTVNQYSYTLKNVGLFQPNFGSNTDTLK